MQRSNMPPKALRVAATIAGGVIVIALLNVLWTIGAFILANLDLNQAP